MTKHDKLLIKFISKSQDFSFKELRTLLKRFGYTEIKTGKTSGSRVAFYHKEKKHIIRIHKPHPQDNLKKYQLDLIEEELKKQDII